MEIKVWTVKGFSHPVAAQSNPGLVWPLSAFPSLPLRAQLSLADVTQGLRGPGGGKHN